MLGIATAINPCPLAAGIAAVAFLGRRPSQSRPGAAGRGAYALGGSLTYVARRRGPARRDAVVLAWRCKTRHRRPGADPHPVGMLLLELFGCRGWAGRRPDDGRRPSAAGAVGGVAAGGVVGVGSFVRRRRRSFSAACCGWPPGTHSWLLLPLAYGLAPPFPVVLAAGVLAFSARLLGQVFAVTAHVARWGQRVAGTVLIAVGVYFAVRFIFHLFLGEHGQRIVPRRTRGTFYFQGPTRVSAVDLRTGWLSGGHYPRMRGQSSVGGEPHHLRRLHLVQSPAVNPPLVKECCRINGPQSGADFFGVFRHFAHDEVLWRNIPVAKPIGLMHQAPVYGTRAIAP